MALERRLKKLEAARGGGNGRKAGAARAKVNARLDHLAETVKAHGDFAHRAESSPAENFTRACLRGDKATALAILGDRRRGRSNETPHRSTATLTG
jgi:hypothetical protein